MAYLLSINYFNSFWLKKVGYIEGGAISDPYTPIWPGLFWNPKGYSTFPINAATFANQVQDRNWYVEESRIRGGYNNTSTDYGVRAYISEENNNQLHRFNSMIYSGVFNSVTDVNRTNVFPLGEAITKSVDPSYGSIQKLYAYDTNLTICQENKISKALIDKDALYTAEGSANVTSTDVVIGQIVPYVGDFGISKNPESFATFGFRRYFTDKYRGTVLRLSRDGLTEISKYGLTDYFRDESAKLVDDFKQFVVENSISYYPSPAQQDVLTLDSDPADIELGMTVTINGVATSAYVTRKQGFAIQLSEPITIPLLSPQIIDLRFTKFVKDKIIGGWDIYNRQYTVSYQQEPVNTSEEQVYQTTSFDEDVLGWPSFYTYNPRWMFSVQDSFFSLKNAQLWKHYDESVINNRGVFYNTSEPSFIEFLINDNPSMKKVFQTVGYEGDNGYEISYFKSGYQQTDPDLPLTNPPTYAAGNKYQDTIIEVKSYDEGLYTDPQGYPQRAGFTRKENLYTTNLVNNSVVRPDEIVFGNEISGIKGYFATVKISTDQTTDVGGLKELWMVNSRFVQSS
jgi:hypothetical protein